MSLNVHTPGMFDRCRDTNLRISDFGSGIHLSPDGPRCRHRLIGEPIQNLKSKIGNLNGCLRPFLVMLPKRLSLPLVRCHLELTLTLLDLVRRCPLNIPHQLQLLEDL